MADQTITDATVSESLNTEETQTVVDTPAGDEQQTDQGNSEAASAEEQVTLSREEYEQLQKSKELATNYKVRAEKAEAKTKKAEAPQNTDSGLSAEESKLYARVYSSDIPDELKEQAIERVQRIAKIDEVDVEKAFASEDFKLWKSRNLKELKDKKAQLPTSRGGQTPQRKTLDTAGLTAEEHKALWKEKQG